MRVFLSIRTNLPTWNQISLLSKHETHTLHLKQIYIYAGKNATPAIDMNHSHTCEPWGFRGFYKIWSLKNIW